MRPTTDLLHNDRMSGLVMMNGILPVVGPLIGQILARGTPTLFEIADPWAYLQSRWVDILRSVDPDGEHRQLHCLCMPPHQRRNLVEGIPGRSIPTCFADDVALVDRRRYVHPDGHRGLAGLSREPERGLEPLTCRLQGGCSTS